MYYSQSIDPKIHKPNTLKHRVGYISVKYMMLIEITKANLS